MVAVAVAVADLPPGAVWGAAPPLAHAEPLPPTPPLTHAAGQAPVAAAAAARWGAEPNQVGRAGSSQEPHEPQEPQELQERGSVQMRRRLYAYACCGLDAGASGRSVLEAVQGATCVEALPLRPRRMAEVHMPCTYHAHALHMQDGGGIAEADRGPLA